jgi:hypothetical protein
LSVLHIAITAEDFEVIVAALPVGSVMYEAQLDARGRRLICLERTAADKLGEMHGPGESYSDVIMRLAITEGG